MTFRVSKWEIDIEAGICHLRANHIEDKIAWFQYHYDKNPKLYGIKLYVIICGIGLWVFRRTK